MLTKLKGVDANYNQLVQQQESDYLELPQALKQLDLPKSSDNALHKMFFNSATSESPYKQWFEMQPINIGRSYCRKLVDDIAEKYKVLDDPEVYFRDAVFDGQLLPRRLNGDETEYYSSADVLRLWPSRDGQEEVEKQPKELIVARIDAELSKSGIPNKTKDALRWGKIYLEIKNGAEAYRRMRNGSNLNPKSAATGGSNQKKILAEWLRNNGFDENFLDN